MVLVEEEKEEEEVMVMVERQVLKVAGKLKRSKSEERIKKEGK